MHPWWEQFIQWLSQPNQFSIAGDPGVQAAQAWFDRGRQQFAPNVGAFSSPGTTAQQQFVNTAGQSYYPRTASSMYNTIWQTPPQLRTPSAPTQAGNVNTMPGTSSNVGSVVPAGYQFNQFASTARGNATEPIYDNTGRIIGSRPANAATPNYAPMNTRPDLVGRENPPGSRVIGAVPTSAANATTPGGGGAGGRVADPYLDYAYRNLDARLGKGFTDQFIQHNSRDPIRFYMDEFKNRPQAAGWDLPDARGNAARQYLLNAAAYAAESDAKFQPGAIAEWQKVHGNTEIPLEQWQRWHNIALSTGGDPLSVGVGQNPWGVY